MCFSVRLFFGHCGIMIPAVQINMQGRAVVILDGCDCTAARKLTASAGREGENCGGAIGFDVAVHGVFLFFRTGFTDRRDTV